MIREIDFGDEASFLHSASAIMDFKDTVFTFRRTILRLFEIIMV